MVVLEASRDIPNSKLQYSSWHFKKKLYFCRLNKTIFGKTLLQYKRQLTFIVSLLVVSCCFWYAESFAFRTGGFNYTYPWAVSYTHLRAHETSLHRVCRLRLEKTVTGLVLYTHCWHYT